MIIFLTVSTPVTAMYPRHGFFSKDWSIVVQSGGINARSRFAISELIETGTT